MPHRPPDSPVEDLVATKPYTGISGQTPVVITSVSMLNPSVKPDLTEFKPLSSHMANPPQDGLRPNTSQGVVKRSRRMSFSRPLTSDGPKAGPPPAVPQLPAPIHTQVSDASRIGVAVGSPTHYNHDPSRIPKPVTGFRRPSRANTDEPVTPFVPEWVVKEEQHAEPKVKRWRSVGSLFKKKKVAAMARPPSPIYDEEETPQKPAQGKTETKRGLVATPPAEKFPARKSSLRPRLRSRSFNNASKPKATTAPPQMPVRPLPRADVVKITSHLAQNDSRDAAIVAPWSDFQEEVRRRQSKPRLDVLIPSTEFERYSVMFSGLLKEPLTREPPTPSPKLIRPDIVPNTASIGAVTVTPSTKQGVTEPLQEASTSGQVNTEFLRPSPPTINTSVHNSQGSPNTAMTPKSTGYSLFPTVKASPSPSVSPQPMPVSRSNTPESNPPALKAPSPTPHPNYIVPGSLAGDHILSQHSDPILETGHGLGLESRYAPPMSKQAKPVPSPLGQVELRSQRMPEFGPESPVSPSSTCSSMSFGEPSALHSHKVTKPVGQLGHSPGPSISSYIESYHTAVQEQEAFEVGQRNQIGSSASPRDVSLKPEANPKPLAKTPSPQLGYGGRASPQVGVARQVSVTSSTQRPQVLTRTSSKKAHEEAMLRARLQGSTPRKGILVDNSDKPDEDTWLQRRSRWGIIEEGGRVVC